MKELYPDLMTCQLQAQLLDLPGTAGFMLGMAVATPEAWGSDPVGGVAESLGWGDRSSLERLYEECKRIMEE